MVAMGNTYHKLKAMEVTPQNEDSIMFLCHNWLLNQDYSLSMTGRKK